MKAKFFLGTLLLAVLGFAMKPAWAEKIPQFSDYPSGQTYSGPTAPLNLSSPDARQFRTRLKEAAQGKVNFAGHYILTYWGCGTSCLVYAAIDALTGKVSFFPFTVIATGVTEEGPVSSRVDSDLLIIRGSLNEAPEEGTYYYRWNKGRMVLISSKTVQHPPNERAR